MPKFNDFDLDLQGKKTRDEATVNYYTHGDWCYSNGDRISCENGGCNPEI